MHGAIIRRNVVPIKGVNHDKTLAWNGIENKIYK